MKSLSELRARDGGRTELSGFRPVRPGGRPSATVRRRWAALVVVVALVIPTLVSYGEYLTAPGNVALSIRSTEWLRIHHFRWLVNDIENFYYTHHQPKKGGAPSGAVAGQISSGAKAGAGAGSGSRTLPPSSAVLPDPAPIQPFVATPLAGEGQWKTISTVNGHPAIEAAYLRPDAVHTSLVSAVAWIDPKVVKAVGYAGVEEPGGVWPDQAPIAVGLRSQLVAAFNSGFKMQDAQGGYYANGRYARPLVAGQATAWIDAKGDINVGQWGRDITMSPNVVFARQNLALIVDDGQPVPDVLSGNTSKWGVTVGNKVLVWRSGLGVTADGAVVYAAGDGLSALTLAQLLSRAGAVRAMEMDINSAWTCFFTYGEPAAGTDPSSLVGGLTVTKLLADMQPSTSNYLTASSRDFFALFQR
ncbi:phosphodiester glycosidase family protein [Acidiferrimicrobium sp. IK]|uniref:phosphodiester glycosidase family protein n=1 Tax=Acidiferrimicrobium sp. IK TaxID=2871700 RepID=UPI0021CB3B35|nr:phosphodiester glycosidase family protein [Acidiferrimicrobium sp. IK]MCU4185331.1 phosphodiester glycosidase family protein [Acidiferrimicrobium sp. IK]